LEFRTTIESALKEIDSNVFYGKVPESALDDAWNYLVFGKKRLKKAGQSGIDLCDYYWIGIIREEYIPDQLVFDIIDKLNSIPGLKLVDEDGEYDYTFKGKTDLVVEILTLTFAKIKKCGNLCQ
jgi:hypothetical protein